MSNQLLIEKAERFIISAKLLNEAGDYATVSQLNKADIEQLIKEADDFVKAGKQWLADNPFTP